jgi:hypothetical protein
VPVGEPSVIGSWVPEGTAETYEDYLQRHGD